MRNMSYPSYFDGHGAVEDMRMADIVTPEKRSAMMAAVRGKNTKPELIVRQLVHRAGYRFRLHRRDLPGAPDLVLPSRRVAIFVHGCFWHGHSGCRYATVPKTRREFWLAKVKANRLRDARAKRALQKSDWRVIVIWECETRHSERLQKVLLPRLTC
jgi:DNA mismatch endonuclease, patch repair protein